MAQHLIENEQLQVIIDELGAQMLSIKDHQGNERLWCGDPAIWAYHAPNLFPVAGAFKNGAYFLRGQIYQMPRHGFARTSQFTYDISASHAERAKFILTEKNPGFPFDYRFQVEYALDHNKLSCIYHVTNTGGEDLYFGMGSHEAFSCPEGIEEYRLVFPEKENLISHTLHNSQISDITRSFGRDIKVFPLKEEDYMEDALVFLSLRSRSVTLENLEQTKSVRVDFEGMDYLLLWTKPGAPFFCIEPWCNPPERSDFNQNIEEKVGVLHLKPGESLSRTHKMSFFA